MWLQMINVQEFARRLSTLGADAFTSDDVVDLATAADVRISADLEIDADLAQRLLDRISPALPVTGAQIAASQWPPPMSSPVHGASGVVLQSRCRRWPDRSADSTPQF
jgi:hypothetical protein